MKDKRSRILIVDDNKDIHEDIKNILSPEIINPKDNETQRLRDELFGETLQESEQATKTLNIKYQIDDAYQGDEAVRMVQNARMEGNPYALIFMDIRMPPGMDGVQTIAKIWAISPDVEVVICTAYSDYSWEQILFKLGQTDHLLFIKKPFDFVAVKQIALALTTKWRLEQLNQRHIVDLETEVKKRTQELMHIASYDPLTNLLNRHSFYKVLTEVTKNPECRQRKKGFYLFFIDIDDFKQVNDFLGHDIGDQLLKEISGRIQAVLRKNSYKVPDLIGDNTGRVLENNAIFRLGGDEFTAIVILNDKKQAAKIAAELVAKIKNKYLINESELQISCSVGISIFPDDSLDANVLLKNADTAMYRAKDFKGAYFFFNEIKDSIFVNQLTLAKDLRHALDHREIKLSYQGLLNNREKIIGIEALIRWVHPQMGELKPDDIIYIAEKSNLFVEIGEYAIKTACRHLNELHNLGYNNLFMLVNCTIKQFYDPNFVNIVISALEEAKIEPKSLKLGLEEKNSLQDPEKSLEIIHKLNQIGVQFTIDGLGRGESLFNFLQRLPQNTIIRIDKTYVHNIAQDKHDQKFLLLMLDLLKSRNLNAIVSGIETQEQKNLLIPKDCILQGFHFNRPKSFEALLDELKSE
jgi:diguanylate cyclase (GGDEF)-like protein